MDEEKKSTEEIRSEEGENRDVRIIREKIKSRPVNKGKLAKSTLISAVSALVFGLVACIAFFSLAPVVSGYFEKDEEEEKPRPQVIFPNEPLEEEINPEDMLITSDPVIDLSEFASLSEEEIEKAMSMVEFSVSDYQNLYQKLTEIANTAKKSIVRVSAVKTDTDWFDNMFEETSEKCGLIVADNGIDLFIVTYLKDLSNADEIYVTFSNETSIRAETVAVDTRTDLCVLSVSLYLINEETKASYDIATLGSSNSSRLAGSLVIAIGSPMGNYGSLNYGMITSVNREINVTDHLYRQITTDIYGSSAATGVLINLKGEILGIIDTKYSDNDTKNLISAIGMTELKGTIEDMINGKELVRFGVIGANVPNDAVLRYNAPRGAFIKTVEMDSPAMAGGIQAGDIITAVNGRPIKSYIDLVGEIKEMIPDEETEITVSRQSVEGYKSMTFAIVPELLGGTR